MERIEKIQYMGALAVTGAWQGSDRSRLYEEIGWETLSDRRMSRRAIQLYKIANNITPTYLREKLPPKNDLFYIVQMRLLFFVNCDATPLDTQTVSFLMQFLLGASLLIILP